MFFGVFCLLFEVGIIGFVELGIVGLFIFYEIIELFVFVGYEWEEEVLLNNVLFVFDVVVWKGVYNKLVNLIMGGSCGMRS